MPARSMPPCGASAAGATATAAKSMIGRVKRVNSILRWWCMSSLVRGWGRRFDRPEYYSIPGGEGKGEGRAGSVSDRSGRLAPPVTVARERQLIAQAERGGKIGVAGCLRPYGLSAIAP